MPVNRYATFSHPSVAPIRWALLALTTLLSGCSPGPDTVNQYAVQGLFSAALSLDGNHAVVGSIHHGGSAWDVNKAERLYNWNHSEEGFTAITASAISGDGKVAATASGSDMVIWRMDDGSPMDFRRAPGRILSLALSNDGSQALLGLFEGQAVLMDVARGSIVQQFDHAGPVRSVDLDQAGAYAITGSDDRSARLWNLADGTLRWQVEHGNQVQAVALSGDGQQFFSHALREDAMIRSSDDNQLRHSVKFNYKRFSAMRFSDDGKQLLLGSAIGELVLIDLNTGTVAGKWRAKPRRAWAGGQSNTVLAVAFAKQGGYLAVLSDGLQQHFSQ